MMQHMCRLWKLNLGGKWPYTGATYQPQQHSVDVVKPIFSQVTYLSCGCVTTTMLIYLQLVAHPCTKCPEKVLFTLT